MSLSNNTDSKYAAPNLRFGTAFLDTKYRNRAINGEVLMDKSVGSITYKRPDGTYMMFDREDVDIANWIMQIRTLYASNPNYKYPTPKDDEEIRKNTYMMGILYDLQYFNSSSETTRRIEEGASLINNNDNRFNIYKGASGFFFKPMVRPRDVAIVNLLSHVHDEYIPNYTGEDPICLKEKELLSENGNIGNNVRVRCKLYCYKDSNLTNTHEWNVYGRVQEVNYSEFPIDITEYDYVKLSILNTSLPKVYTGLMGKDSYMTEPELAIFNQVNDTLYDINYRYMEVYVYTKINEENYTPPTSDNTLITTFLNVEGVFKLFDRVDTLTSSGLIIDDEPVKDSINPISSSAVYKINTQLQEEIKKSSDALNDIISKKIPDDLKIENNNIYLSVKGEKIGNGQKLPAGIVIQTTSPSDTSVLWIDTSIGGVIKYYNGNTWVTTKAVWG